MNAYMYGERIIEVVAYLDDDIVVAVCEGSEIPYIAFTDEVVIL